MGRSRILAVDARREHAAVAPDTAGADRAAARQLDRSNEARAHFALRSARGVIEPDRLRRAVLDENGNARVLDLEHLLLRTEELRPGRGAGGQGEDAQCRKPADRDLPSLAYDQVAR